MALLEGFVSEVPQVYNSEGQPITDQADFDNLNEDFQAGKIFFQKGAKIKVQDPSTNIIEIDADSVPEALRQGYKLDTPAEQYKRALVSEYTSGSKQLQAALLGTARGLSIGTSDPLLEMLGVDMEKVKTIKELNEGASIGGEVLGTVAPMFFSGGTSAAASAAGKAAQTAARMTPISLVTKAGRAIEEGIALKMSAEASSIGGRALQLAAPKMVAGAAEGAVFGLGNALSESALGDHEMNAEYLAGQVGMGSLIGAGFGSVLGVGEAVAPTVGKIIERTKATVGEGAKKAVSTMLNVSPEALENYIKRKTAIDAGIETLDDLVLENKAKIDDILQSYDKAEISFDKATQNFKDLKKDYLNTLKERRFYNDNEVKATKQLFDQAQESLIKKIDDDLLLAGEQIAKGAELKRKRLAEGSAKAFDILDDGEIYLTTDKVNKILDDNISYYAGLPSQEARATAKNLEVYKANLAESAENGIIPGAKVKSIIQDLDEHKTFYNQDATSFDKALNTAYKEVRFGFDSELKKFKPYRDAMRPVAQDAKDLQALKRYGDEFTASRSLRNIDDPVRLKYELSALKKLEDEFGLKFMDDINKFLKKDELISALPENVKLRNLADEQNKIKEKLMPRSVQEELAKSEDYKTLLDASAIYKQKELEKAGLNGLTGNGVQNLFKKAGTGDKVALDKVQKLEKFLGSEGLSQMVQDAGLVKYFEKTAMNGSRNVNMLGGLGLLAGTLLDQTIAGGMGGIFLGGMVDRFGPAMAKILLDKYTTMAAVEKTGMEFAKRQASKINAFMGTKNMGQLSKELSLPVIMQNRDEKEQKKLKSVSQRTQAELNSTFQKVQEIVSNKEAFMHKLNSETAEISKHMPETAQAIKNKAVAAVDFLGSKLPKKGLEYSLKIKSRPSDYEVTKFNKYWEAVDNPMVVFDSLKKGVVHPEHVEVMKQVYPKMYQDTFQYITENITELQKEMPYAKRLALSQFFGVPLDPSSDSSMLLRLQSQVTPQVQEQMNAGLQQAEVKPMKLDKIDLKSKMSNMERLAKRG
jgi:hypothetical protein